jgi:hypothetical protein
MSHSHDFSGSLPADLECSLLEALTGGEHTLMPRKPSGLYGPVVPRPVLVAELVRRGWSRRPAEHWYEGYFHWARHERASARRWHSRRYRRISRALLSSGRPEQVLPYRKSAGYLTW